MNKLFILGLVITANYSVMAQVNADSLFNIWNDKSAPDSLRLRAISDIAYDVYMYADPDSAYYYAQVFYDFAKQLGNKKAMAVALNIQGISYYTVSDYNKAIEYYKRSMHVQEEIGNRQGIANSLNLIGSIFQERGRYINALHHYQKSVQLSRELGDHIGIATTLLNIGVIYKIQGKYDKALEYYNESLAIDKVHGEKYDIASTLGNIGNVLKFQNKYNEAIQYCEESLELFYEIENMRGASNAISNIGTIYSEMGQNEKALEYFRASYKMDLSIGNQWGYAAGQINIGKAYMNMNQHADAVSFCRKGLQIADSIEATAIQQEGCDCLYKCYQVLGNGNLALVYLQKIRVHEDTLQAKATAEKLQQMEFEKQMVADSLKQEQEKLRIQMAHEKEIRKKKRNQNIAAISGVFFLLLAIGFYSRWRYVRKSRDIISQEKDRSENLLLNILPAEIAEELKEKGRANARDYDMVSILFTDFKGFTQTSEKLTAQNLVEEINHYFEAFDAISGRYGIEKIKTIGDAYMAAGGLPIPSHDSVKNTVLAAMEMQSFVSNRIAELSGKGLPAFEMRVGIHTGPVVAGIVGVKKFQYDIWGDTVNTASRVESAGEVGKVNISQSTYEQLKDNPEFVFESRGNIEVKGKGELAMWFVTKKSV